MKPAKFDYIAVADIDEAVAALVAANGDGKVIAGGQSLMPLLNFRMARPAILVDINRIAGLSFIETRNDRIAIGALTRHCDIERSELIAANLPVMFAAIRHVAHLAIRNRGTIGGSLSHADPAAELPMLAVFYDATIKVQGPGGRRSIAAEDFFVDALTSCLEADDIVCEIEFPILASHTGWAFEEVSRRHGDFALASIAVSLARQDGVIVDARVAAMGIADTPLRLRSAEGVLRGAKVGPGVAADFAECVRTSVSPSSDIHASSDYRRRLVGSLAERALLAATARAEGTAS